jgi:hypothetical protein
MPETVYGDVEYASQQEVTGTEEAKKEDDSSASQSSEK